jgi:cytochrome c oxidase assembly protein subunit 15
VIPGKRLRWFRRLAFVALLWCALVVVLGAWVRLTAAGLGCPDWPTCYGHLHPAHALEKADDIAAAFPNRPFDYGKALREMVHRYAALGIGALTLLLAVLAVANRRDRDQPVAAPVFLFLFVLLQGIFGALTVTWKLAPPIVTLHLLGGFTVLATLWWLCLQPEPRNLHVAEWRLRRFALFALAVLVLQIALGGWTSSNYAAIACPDFPTCQGSWWPTMDVREAFVPWRGLGHDYEGGVLAPAARVAIHFAHRVWAGVTAIVLISLAIKALLRARSRRMRLAAVAVAAAVLLQIAIGIAMVLKGFPLDLATAHNAGAALLLLAVVALLRSLWPVPEAFLRIDRRR